MPPLHLSVPDTGPMNIREVGVRDGSSPSQSFETGASGGERRFRVTWEERFNFVKYMLGYSETYIDMGTRKLSRLIPQAIHPDTPDIRATRVVKMAGHKWTGTDPARGEGAPYEWSDDLVNVFQDADITVGYEHLDYKYLEDDDVNLSTEQDRYVVRGETRPSAEYVGLPGAVMKYRRSVPASGAPHGLSIPFNVGKILPQEVFELTWCRLPEDVWGTDAPLYQTVYGTGAIDDVPYLGCVNSEPFQGRPAGTVLFSGMRPQLNRSPLGTGWEWDLGFEFTYDPNFWNWKYYFDRTGSAAGWYQVGQSLTYTAENAYPDEDSLYNVRDLNFLFSVAD
jgi:hypothetical protein